MKFLGKRTPETQSDHDKCVNNKANEWKNDGWTVKADLEGWDKPSEIGGFIPDIEATNLSQEFVRLRLKIL